MPIFRGIVSTAEFSAVFYLDSHKASNGKSYRIFENALDFWSTISYNIITVKEGLNE